MSDEPTVLPIIQPSLLEEPAGVVTLRLHVQAGEPLAQLSYTITRPDGSWLACEVVACEARPEAVRAKVAKLIGEALRKTFELIGPFA